MPPEEDDDLYDDDFDFVDEEDEDEVNEVDDIRDDTARETEPPEESTTERPRRGGRRPRGEHRAEPRADRRAGPRDDTRDADYRDAEPDAEQAEESVDEYGRPEPAANYVVHIYEHKKFKRTLERPFTPEEAEAFATEYNRASKAYHRFALAGKNDTKPKKVLE